MAKHQETLAQLQQREQDLSRSALYLDGCIERLLEQVEFCPYKSEEIRTIKVLCALIQEQAAKHTGTVKRMRHEVETKIRHGRFSGGHGNV